MRLIPEPVMWDAAYDYVRLTAKELPGDDETAFLYQRAARHVLARVEGEAHNFKQWYWLGYRGETCDCVQYGTGPAGHIFQASRWAADDARGLALRYDGVPRVDVAVTLWYEQDDPGVAERVADRSAAISASKGAVGWKVNLRKGYGNGDTAYIGARTSDCYIRVYDKWREGGQKEEYRYAWRVECEWHNEAAASIWAAAGSSSPGREYLAAIVAGECRRRGVYLPALAPRGLPIPPRYRRVETTTESRLAWLENQVAPAVASLMADGVRPDHICGILGIPAPLPDEQPRSCGSSAKENV